MHITFFTVWMTVLWSSILILIFYVLRTKYKLIDICSVSGVIVLYLFCMIRMIIPVEFPWTKIIFGGTKDNLKPANSTGYHYNDSKMLLERFQLIANIRHKFIKRGNILAWVISGCLLFISYSFVFQTQYDAPKEDIETQQGAHEVDIYNSYLIKTDDGTYLLHTPNKDIAISGEMAQLMIEEGFNVIIKSQK